MSDSQDGRLRPDGGGNTHIRLDYERLAAELQELYKAHEARAGQVEPESFTVAAVPVTGAIARPERMPQFKNFDLLSAAIKEYACKGMAYRLDRNMPCDYHGSIIHSTVVIAGVLSLAKRVWWENSVNDPFGNIPTFDPRMMRLFHKMGAIPNPKEVVPWLLQALHLISTSYSDQPPHHRMVEQSEMKAEKLLSKYDDIFKRWRPSTEPGPTQLAYRADYTGPVLPGTTHLGQRVNHTCPIDATIESVLDLWSFNRRDDYFPILDVLDGARILVKLLVKKFATRAMFQSVLPTDSAAIRQQIKQKRKNTFGIAIFPPTFDQCKDRVGLHRQNVYALLVKLGFPGSLAIWFRHPSKRFAELWEEDDGIDETTAAIASEIIRRKKWESNRW